MIDRQQLLRDLAAAERDAQPDLEAEARNWAGIERRLIHGPGPPSLPEPGVTALLLKKWIGGLALVGGLIGGGVLLGSGPVQDPPVPTNMPMATDLERQADPPAVKPDPVPAPVLIPEAVPEPKVIAPDLSPETDPRPRSKAKIGRKPEPLAEPAEPLDLAAELRLLGSIRAALKRGDSEVALAGIAEHKRDFGAAGALVQERSAHEVEALCAAGKTADARRLAGEFLGRYPDSPHRARVAAECAEK